MGDDKVYNKIKLFPRIDTTNVLLRLKYTATTT